MLGEPLLAQIYFGCRWTNKLREVSLKVWLTQQGRWLRRLLQGIPLYRLLKEKQYWASLGGDVFVQSLRLKRLQDNMQQCRPACRPCLHHVFAPVGVCQDSSHLCGYYATMQVARARISCMPALQIPADSPLECSAVLICLCDRMHQTVRALPSQADTLLCWLLYVWPVPSLG